MNPIYFGCDFLEFTVKSFDLNFFKKYNFTFGLDFDNSSQGFINTEYGVLSYRRVNLKNYSYSLIFTLSIDNIPFDLFYIARGQKNKANIKTKNKVGFYSTFFVLNNLGKLNFNILDFYLDNFYHKDNKLHRLDICLDVANTIEELNGTLFNSVNFFSSLGKDKKNDLFSQTYYIKNPLNSDNRFYIFRIYDKILDSVKKGKNFLFSYIDDFDDVRRIELELRQDSCSMIIENIEDILKNKNYILEKIFKTYLIKKGNSNIDYLNKYTFFNEIGALSLLSNIKKRIDLKETYGKLKHIPKNYISMGHGYINNIYNVSGFNGLFELLFKSQINSDLKKENEKVELGYKIYDELLSYFEKNSLYYNPDIITKIFSKYKNSIKNKNIRYKINVK